MKCLLDTHIFFWWIANDPRLSEKHRSILTSRDVPVFVSAVSAWEMSIKHKLGKWPEVAVLLPDIASKAIAEGFQTLDVTLAQAERAGQLDLSHRDPFDRLLATQALDLGIPVLTADVALSRLGCTIVT